MELLEKCHALFDDLTPFTDKWSYISAHNTWKCACVVCSFKRLNLKISNENLYLYGNFANYHLIILFFACVVLLGTDTAISRKDQTPQEETDQELFGTLVVVTNTNSIQC